jgi:hypothetical protein
MYTIYKYRQFTIYIKIWHVVYESIIFTLESDKYEVINFLNCQKVLVFQFWLLLVLQSPGLYTRLLL